ncbi:hypothetical protein [Actinoplanes subglobosus]|uniref:Bulb-type lectin domain-containing protein n=1 Tax=Actinoplanes subglobosus TaxID=1547892 RepID=A0ABV8IVK2_9ACTN
MKLQDLLVRGLSTVTVAMIAIASGVTSAQAQPQPSPTDSANVAYVSPPLGGASTGPSSLPLSTSTATGSPRSGVRTLDTTSDISPETIARVRAAPIAQAESQPPAEVPGVGQQAVGAQAAAAAAEYPAYANVSRESSTPAPSRATFRGVDTWRLPGETYLFADLPNLPDNYVSIGKCVLVMQDDGNLVLYDTGGAYNPSAARWSSGTYGNAHAYARFQSDGNFVLYDNYNRPLRNRLPSNTYGSGFNLHVQADCNVVVYAPVWLAKWATNTSF